MTLGNCPVCEGKGQLKQPYERLTPRQLEVLQVYLDMNFEENPCPTLGFVAGRLKVSKETVHQHLQRIEEKGYVHRVRNASAGVHVLFNAEGEEL